MADALCIASGAKMLKIAAAVFTLTWIHSVEKIAWQEDWAIEEGRLKIVEARVKGSGAGMDPAEGAVLKDGWWHYAPKLPPQRELNLAASGATVSGWTLCTKAKCYELGRKADSGIRITACDNGKS